MTAGAVGTLALLGSGCSSLLPKPPALPVLHSLDHDPRPASFDAHPQAQAVLALAPVLQVNTLSASAGFDSRRIIYFRQPHKLEYFARHEWVETPARMLAPLVVAALAQEQAFAAVIASGSAVAADLSLDLQLIRLQQDFTQQPSQVRLTLRAYLLNQVSHQLQAWGEFDHLEPALSPDPEAGVLAANKAVQIVLVKLAAFCAQASRSWQGPAVKS